VTCIHSAHASIIIAVRRKPLTTAAAKSAAHRWAREKEAKIGAAVRMWWTDGSCSDDGRVGAAVVCKHGNEWRSRCRILGTRGMEVFDAELLAIMLALDVAIENRETLQVHGVKMVAVFSDSQAAIRRVAHLEPGPWQRLARRINRGVWSLLAHSIATKIHWVPGYSGISGNKEANRQASLARDTSGSTVMERPYSSALNRARRISEGRSAAKAEWEADKCSKHFSYRLQGKARTNRPIAMTTMKSLAARFHRLKSGHAPTGGYLKRFGHRDDKCWWCGGTVAQTREHLFRHCSRWKDQHKTHWITVGQTTGWKAGRCRHVQISELFTTEECDQAVMDFWRPLRSGNFRQNEEVGWSGLRAGRLGGGAGGNGIILFFLSFFLVPFVFRLSFICERGRRVVGGELCHLASLPEGRGDIRVLSYSN